MASTRDLSDLPPPAALKPLMQSLAMLDALLEAQWEYRYFSFNAHWAPGEQLGSMRNGQGDDLFALFGAAGCFVRGFAHESEMSPWNEEPPRVWPGVLDGVPQQFAAALTEPAFSMDGTTFCIWYVAGGQAWETGAIDYPEDDDDPDGSGWMLAWYKPQPEVYRDYAAEYFELDVPLDAIARLYRHEPLSPALVAAIGSTRPWDELLADAREIGYPMQDAGPH